MPSPKEVYREACRRLHRALGNYFAIRAWCANTDCVILQRRVLEKLLDVERLRESRMSWIEEDFKSWFPYIHILTLPSRYSVGSIYLSRVDISEHMGFCVTDDERLRILRSGGIKTILYDHKSTVPERIDDLLSELNLMAAGIKPAPKIALQES